MKRKPFSRGSRGGFTLVELMTATALTLIVMSILATVFVKVTNSITKSRATIEMNSRLTAVAFRLQKDLEGYTVHPNPLRKDFTDGYLAIIEGPIRTGALQGPGNNYLPKTTPPKTTLPKNPGRKSPYVRPLYWPVQEGSKPLDTTLGDRDDVLMLTTRSVNEPFVGRYGVDPNTNSPGTYTSEVAEVVWFLRGTTLYRRILLVGSPNLPGSNVPVAWWSDGGGSFGQFVDQLGTSNGVTTSSVGTLTSPSASFYDAADVAIYRDPLNRNRLLPCTLADLSIHGRRFWNPVTFPSPPDPRLWGVLGMPTQAENAVLRGYITLGWRQNADWSKWRRPDWNNWDRRLYPYRFSNTPSIDPQTGWTNPNPNPPRAGEDVILSDVIGFDVKVWDPGAPVFADSSVTPPAVVLPEDPNYPANPAGSLANAVSFGAYVDIGYAPDYNPAAAGAPVQAQFHHFGYNNVSYNRSPMRALGGVPQCVYDTWSDFYERDGNGRDFGLNGYDDNNIGGVDDITEWETPPPYPVPLRGVKITVRVIDPDTDQVREVSIVQDFILE